MKSVPDESSAQTKTAGVDFLDSVQSHLQSILDATSRILLANNQQELTGNQTAARDGMNPSGSMFSGSKEIKDAMAQLGNDAVISDAVAQFISSTNGVISELNDRLDDSWRFSSGAPNTTTYAASVLEEAAALEAYFSTQK